jgi:hypothetical protein
MVAVSPELKVHGVQGRVVVDHDALTRRAYTATNTAKNADMHQGAGRGIRQTPFAAAALHLRRTRKPKKKGTWRWMVHHALTDEATLRWTLDAAARHGHAQASRTGQVLLVKITC